MGVLKPKQNSCIWGLAVFALGLLWPYCRATASPYQYAQVLTGIDHHHTIINSATKDHSGIIWVVSGGSLYRYNGVSITAFSTLYSQKLPFDEVTHIMADTWGNLWIDTRNGLYVFDLNTWSFVDNNHGLYGLTGKPILAFYNAGESVYVADRDGWVWVVEKSTKTRLFYFDCGAVEERKPVGKLLVADSDDVWLAYGGLLHHFKMGTKVIRHMQFPRGVFGSLEDMLTVKGGVLIRSHSQGYYVYDGQSFRFLPRADFPTADFTNWNHWSFTTEDKVVVFHEKSYLEYSRDTAFTLLRKDTHIMDINILHKRLNAWQCGSNEWLLSTNDGLFSVFPARFGFDFLETGSARGMAKHQGAYYFGGYGYLDMWSKNQGLRPRRDAPENNYYAFLPWSEDTVFIALEGDFLSYLVNGNVVKAPVRVPLGTPVPLSGMAYCLARYAADTLLVGTSNGIWKYAVPSGRVYPFVGDEQDFFSYGMQILSISIHDGIIGFSTPEGFFEWRDGEASKIYPQGNYKLNIYAHQYQGDSLYLGTKGRGLIVLDRRTHIGRVIRQGNGLAGNTVYSMAWVEDALVMGTHEGLSIMKGGHLFNYYSTDGLPFEEFNHQAAYYDQEENLLFMGGVGGYIRFRVSDLLTPMVEEERFAPRLSGIHVGLKTNRAVDRYAGVHAQDTIHLPREAVWLSMDFARPDHYRRAYKMLFKIVPLMNEYQEMPVSSQINLSGISAGIYFVSVKIQALGHVDAGITHTWVIHKKPVFTETPVFLRW